ncbi:MAG: hypothetical protein KDC43_03925 [Saprospiraceae bacterium]|nr:hypothetical protein [Saprospiraceae bacterium]MCB0623074.1 hypothetical protein [Saprospiraceae bacterium]MCB0676757.1 hypothetical protein [Saprospiraceae bacterium]MCB0683972.1 hypothetical protein [Saprospiraceae bacterium]
MKWDKKFSRGQGKYYFTIKSNPSNITLHRESKEDAANAYRRYMRIGKECEWHGRWNGKKFEEASPPPTIG